jgi:hypothetical protein
MGTEGKAQFSNVKMTAIYSIYLSKWLMTACSIKMCGFNACKIKFTPNDCKLVIEKWPDEA